MGKVSNLAIRIYLDEYNLSGFLNASELGLDQNTAVVTCFSDTGPRRVVGNYDTKHSLGGFFDAADNEYDEQAFVNFRTDEEHYLAQLFGANAEGSNVYESVVRVKSQPRRGGANGAVVLDLSAEGSNGGIFRGTVLANATVTGAGNRAGRNMGATTLGQIFAVVFRLVTFTGTNITLKVQESSDDAAGDPYADIAGLTSGALTAAGTVRTTTTAVTEAWKRVNIAGTFTSAVIVVTAGRVAGS